MSSSGHRAVSSANHRSSPNNGYVTFYDWSTSPVSWHKAGERLQKDGQHSKLPARPPKDGTTSRTKMKQWITVEPNARNYSGRMFLREKTSLTKGEKEIITGICKNRGDMPSGKTLDEVGQRLFTHRDAWLVGKQIKPSLPPVEKDSASEDLNVDLRINSVRGKDSGFSERSTPNGTPRMSIESAEHWEHVQRTYNHHRFRVRSQRGKENPYEDLCERPSSPVGTNTYKVIPQITDAKRVEVYLPKLSSTDLEEDHPQDQGFEEEEVTEEDMESERGGMGEFVESEEEEENEEDEELMMTTPSSSHVDVTLAPPCTPTSQ